MGEIGQTIDQELPEIADVHWVLVRDDSSDRNIIGRCSLWWQNTPSYLNHRVGFIGHYAVKDAATATQLLQQAGEQLAAFGCNLAIAPIDGNTWHRYRLVTERGTHPVFFLEPDNPDDWPCHFLDQGFTPLAQYSSALNANLSYVDPRLERVKSRLNKAGVEIRPINMQRIEAELHGVFEVAIASFQSNFLYTPITEAAFVALYRPLLPYLNPELILIAEDNNKPVGFLFAIPDWLQAQRGETVNTIVIKTVAVLPKRIYAGLGNLLVATCQTRAYEKGFTRAIHALMHDANPSRNLSRRYAQTIRRYTLFAKNI